MAIILEKYITVKLNASDRKTMKSLTKYLHICDSCGEERGYFIKTFDKVTKNKGLCRSCAAKLLPAKTTETREKISKARTGKPTWTGGKHTEKSLEKMRNSAKNRIRKINNYSHEEETKQKISCTRRKINLIDFDGFLTEEDEKQRTLFKYQGLHWQCFEKANYMCDCCFQKRSTDVILNAHHLDGWNWAIDKRFDISNLVTLCERCHEEFHNVYGKGNNTKEQYEVFKWQKQQK